MDFYQTLSRYYDEIFAADEAEMRFIRDLLPPKARLLDIGCGTGNKTVHFSEGASLVEALDMDEGMIAKARTDHARPNITYSALNMLDIGTVFAGRRFEAALCLGNTLVHLPSPDVMLNFASAVAGLLTEQGCFTLQILNYDRILEQHISDLPLLETPNVRFRRGYAREGERLRFITSLEDKKGGETLHNNIALYPLRKRELDGLLKKAGFRRIAYFGSYLGGELGPDSFVLIACCRAG